MSLSTVPPLRPPTLSSDPASRGSVVRLASWNVHGSPKGTFTNRRAAREQVQKMMEQTGADVLAVQEHQLTQDKVNQLQLSSLPSVDAFFSTDQRPGNNFYRNNFGTAILAKPEICVPFKVEEGLGDRFVQRTSQEDRIGGYPSESQTGLSREKMRKLDSEGRTVITDMGLFVLINVYCPNGTRGSIERCRFKDNFNVLLEARVRNLIAAGREVIVCGDFNVTATALDTSDSSGAFEQMRSPPGTTFENYAPRVWLRALTGKGGPLIDIWREKHPTKGRVDFFLITPGLFPWVHDCSIDRDKHDSDHHPVDLDLKNSIETPTGDRELWKEMNPGQTSEEDELPARPKLERERVEDTSGVLSMEFKPTPIGALPKGNLPTSLFSCHQTASSPSSTSKPTSSTSTSPIPQPSSLSIVSPLKEKEKDMPVKSKKEEKPTKRAGTDENARDEKRQKTSPSALPSSSTPSAPSAFSSRLSSQTRSTSRLDKSSASKPSPVSASTSRSASSALPEVIILDDSDEEEEEEIIVVEPGHEGGGGKKSGRGCS